MSNNTIVEYDLPVKHPGKLAVTIQTADCDVVFLDKSLQDIRKLSFRASFATGHTDDVLGGILPVEAFAECELVLREIFHQRLIMPIGHSDNQTLERLVKRGVSHLPILRLNAVNLEHLVSVAYDIVFDWLDARSDHSELVQVAMHTNNGIAVTKQT